MLPSSAYTALLLSMAPWNMGFRAIGGAPPSLPPALDRYD